MWCHPRQASIPRCAGGRARGRFHSFPCFMGFPSAPICHSPLLSARMTIRPSGAMARGRARESPGCLVIPPPSDLTPPPDSPMNATCSEAVEATKVLPSGAKTRSRIIPFFRMSIVARYCQNSTMLGHQQDDRRDRHGGCGHAQHRPELYLGPGHGFQGACRPRCWRGS